MDGTSLSRFAPVRGLRERRLPVALTGLLLALVGVLVPAGPASAAYPTTTSTFVYCVNDASGTANIYKRNRCPSADTLRGSAQVNLEWQNRSAVVLAGSYVDNPGGSRVELTWDAYNGTKLLDVDSRGAGPGKARTSFSGNVIDGSSTPGGVQLIKFSFITKNSDGSYDRTSATTADVGRP